MENERSASGVFFQRGIEGQEIQFQGCREEHNYYNSKQETQKKMFILTPEQLTGVSGVTAAGDTTKSKLKEYPVGGLIYFSSNLVSEDQTREMLENTKAYGKEIEGLPLFLCIDEEGGRVARIGRNAAFSVEQVKPMGQINNEEEAYQAGTVIGSYLCELGFNVDFAPDADVLTNERNTVIGDRSLAAIRKELHAWPPPYPMGCMRREFLVLLSIFRVMEQQRPIPMRDMPIRKRLTRS